MQDKIIICLIFFLGFLTFLGMLISVRVFYNNVKKNGMVVLSDSFLKFGIVFLFSLYMGYLICMVSEILWYIENNMNLRELSYYGWVIAGFTMALTFLLSQDLVAVGNGRILLFFNHEMYFKNIRIAQVKSVLGRKWIYIEEKKHKKMIITDVESCKKILSIAEN